MVLFLQLYLQQENMKLNSPTRAMLTVTTTLHWHLSLPNETGKLPDWYYIKKQNQKKVFFEDFKKLQSVVLLNE